MLSWTTHEVGGTLVITLEPSPVGIDDRQAKERQALYEIIQSRPDPRFAVDLGGVDYVSSADIGFLITIRRRTDVRKGKLVALRRQFVHTRFALDHEAPAAVPDRRRPERGAGPPAAGVGCAGPRKRSSDHVDPHAAVRPRRPGSACCPADGRRGAVRALGGPGRARPCRQGRRARGRATSRTCTSPSPGCPRGRRSSRAPSAPTAGASGSSAARRARGSRWRSSRPAGPRPTSTSSRTRPRPAAASTSAWSSTTGARRPSASWAGRPTTMLRTASARLEAALGRPGLRETSSAPVRMRGRTGSGTFI